MTKRHFFSFIFAIIFGVSASPVVPDLMRRTDTRACERWVDSVYNSMTERQRVAQLIFPKAVPTQGSNSKAAIKRYVNAGVGGLLFTAGSLDQYVEMTNYAQSIASIPLMMTFDGEWGLSMRIADTPKFPDNMTIGAISDTSLIYKYGLEMARECRMTGIHVNFAPDIDVNSNPKNPVIGRRSFGSDPHRVALLGEAYSRGLEDGGVQAVGKHFPGHGDTSTDSHKEMTTVHHSADQMDKVDLVPFAKYIGAGCSGIMVGHIAVPALDPSGRPASLSRKITHDLLRGKMGFEGLIYTDALGMKGAQMAGQNAALAALQAGSDVLLSSNTPLEDIDVIINALHSGKISQSVIEDRCKRILSYKFALGLTRRQYIEPKGLLKAINSPEAKALVESLAAGSITVLRNSDNILPIGDLAHKSVAVVNISGGADREFSEICAKYTTVDVYNIGDAAIDASTLRRINEHDIVIAATYSDAAICRRAFAQIADHPGLVAVFMINPYKTAKFADALGSAKAIVLAYENIPATRRAAAMAVFGGLGVSGRLPVDLPGLAPLGAGLDIAKSRLGYSSPAAEGLHPSLTDSIDSIASHAIAIGAMPGCQVLIARHGNVVHEGYYGNLTKGGDPVTESTLYDLASVSKAIGTLPGIMKAFDLGFFSLDDNASVFIPGLRDTDKKGITIRQLLYHESGMPPSLNMYDLMIDPASYTGKLIAGKRDTLHPVFIMRGAWGQDSTRMRTDITSPSKSDLTPYEAARGIWVGQAAADTIMAKIYNTPLRKNNKYTYSCLNFCLLMDLEQRATGQTHDRFVTDSIWAPLGAYNACYRPTLSHPLSQIAPTENDTYLRRQLVHGYVHDETAAMQGGVSGNAGVFASVTDIAKVCQMWLNRGKYGDAQVLSPATVDLFMKSKSPTCRRGLGFDKPDTANPANSPTCDEADASVVGHLGFTGTVFWIDPSNDLIFIFLTNRVNPTRDNDVFANTPIRPELFRQVYKALQK